MVKVLISKGWAKNEIIYEMQRVFGNDVLILPNALDDERTIFGKVAPVMLFGLTLSGMFLSSRFGRARF